MAKNRTGKGRGRPRKQRTKSDAPGAVPPMAGHNSEKGSRLTLDEERALFLNHRSAWNGWQAKLKVVDQLGTDVKAALKADGFTVKQFQIADALATAKGELRVVGEVEDRLKVARWIGHPMGAQLDLFNEPDRTPVVDRAADHGKQDSMSNVAARPHDHGYAPDTDAARAYMAGFHEHQAKIASEGIKPLNGGTEAASGERVSRSEFNERLKEQTRADANGAPAAGHPAE